MSNDRFRICDKRIDPYREVMFCLVTADEDAELEEWGRVKLRIKRAYEWLNYALHSKSVEEEDIEKTREDLKKLEEAIGDIDKWMMVMDEVMPSIVYRVFHNFYKCVCGNA
jgi:ATP:corrinoid adenosyltransferase